MLLSGSGEFSGTSTIEIPDSSSAAQMDSASVGCTPRRIAINGDFSSHALSVMRVSCRLLQGLGQQHLRLPLWRIPRTL